MIFLYNTEKFAFPMIQPFYSCLNNQVKLLFMDKKDKY